MITVDFEKLEITPGFRILDIGCGAGRHTVAASRFPDVIVIGADNNFSRLVQTRNGLTFQQDLGECHGAWETCAANILCLPFRNDFFDLVICSEVLEHIHDQTRAICEIVRILKPGRNIAISVPRYLPERICWTLSETYRTTSNGHVRIYRKRELIALMETAGVTTWASHYAHSFHSPFWWLKCLTGRTEDNSPWIALYHKFLVWEMMKRPRVIRLLDALLNPLFGKSLVLYFQKNNR
ncbi:methyltransferase domain-containing protein [Thermodesulfobacteriota bacterium]